MRHNKAVLVPKTSKLDHMADEVLMAYTTHEVVVGSGIQKSAQLFDSV